MPLSRTARLSEIVVAKSLAGEWRKQWSHQAAQLVSHAGVLMVTLAPPTRLEYLVSGVFPLRVPIFYRYFCRITRKGSAPVRTPSQVASGQVGF